MEQHSNRPSADSMDFDGFDDDFFAGLEADMSQPDFQQAAKAALSDILTVEADDGESRTYEQIKAETEAFFANPEIAANMELLQSLAEQYADFCGGHGLDESSGINGDSLGSIYAQGQLSKHDHDHGSAGHGHEDGSRSGKKKRELGRTIFWLMFSYGR